MTVQENGTEPNGEMTRTTKDGHWPGRNLLLTAGLFYLGLIVLGIIAQIVRSDLIVSGDAAATVDRIASSGGMLTISFIADVASEVSFVLLGLTCYLMFRKTDGKTSFAMLLFVVVSGAFALINLMHICDAILLMDVGPASVVDADSVMNHLDMYSEGTYYAQILGWGPWLVPLGCLGHQSRLFPNAVSALLVIGGFGLTLQGFQHFLLPGMDDLFMFGGIISMLAEFSTCGWLIYAGIKDIGPEDEMKDDANKAGAVS